MKSIERERLITSLAGSSRRMETRIFTCEAIYFASPLTRSYQMPSTRPRWLYVNRSVIDLARARSVESAPWEYTAAADCLIETTCTQDLPTRPIVEDLWVQQHGLRGEQRGASKAREKERAASSQRN